MLRVRFAPSPTGWLHVGGARTALFNWLYARNQEGKFILRIEDTDRERSKKKYVEEIKKDLRWLGMDWDEFYRQSDRLEIYRRYARKLLQENKAYKCYCTKEELTERRNRAIDEGRPPAYDGRCRDLNETEQQQLEDEGREPTIRFKLPEKEPEMTFRDLIKGQVHFEKVMTGDFVILKSDGTPSYNFACTLDDHLMEVSHVLRAEDHLSNTPKQIMLYRALGFSLPQFGHLSMLLGPDRSKLSKRAGDTALKQYREQGYLPQAMVNYLAQLGWSSKDEREFFLPQDLIQEFSLKNIVDSPQVFDRDKLDWLGNQHIKNAELDRVTELARPFLEEKGIIPSNLSDEQLSQLRKIVNLLRPSLSNLSELSQHQDLGIFFGTIQLTEEAQEVLEWDNSTPVLKKLKEKLDRAEGIAPDKVTTIVKETKEELGVSFKEIYKPLRAAITGSTSGPEIKEVIAILGYEQASKRIDRILS